MNDADTITDAELREQFERAKLGLVGVTFERALQHESIRKTLINGITAQRRRAARQALTAAIQFQTQETA